MAYSEPQFLTPRHLWYDTPRKAVWPRGTDGSYGPWLQLLLYAEDLEAILAAVDPLILLLNLAGWEVSAVLIELTRGDSLEHIEVALPRMTVAKIAHLLSIAFPPQEKGKARIGLVCKERVRFGDETGTGGRAVLLDMDVDGEGRRYFIVYPDTIADVPRFLRSVFEAVERARRRLIPQIAKAWREPEKRLNESNTGLLGMYHPATWKIRLEPDDPGADDRRRLISALGWRLWAKICAGNIEQFLGQESLPSMQWLPYPEAPIDAASYSEDELENCPVGLDAQEYLTCLAYYGLVERANDAGDVLGRTEIQQELYNLRRRIKDWGDWQWMQSDAGAGDAAKDPKKPWDWKQASIVLGPWFGRHTPFRLWHVRSRTYTRMLMSCQAYGFLDVLSGLASAWRARALELVRHPVDVVLSVEDVAALCRYVTGGVDGRGDAWTACVMLERSYPEVPAESRMEIRHTILFGSLYAYPPDPLATPGQDYEGAPPGTFLADWVDMLRRVRSTTAGETEADADRELITWCSTVVSGIEIPPQTFLENLAVILVECFDDLGDPELRGLTALYAVQFWGVMLADDGPRRLFDEDSFLGLCNICREVGTHFSRVEDLRAGLRNLLSRFPRSAVYGFGGSAVFSKVWSLLVKKSSQELSIYTSGPLFEYFYCITGLVYFSTADELWRGRIDLLALSDRMHRLERESQDVRSVMSSIWKEVIVDTFGSNFEDLAVEHRSFVTSARYVAFVSCISPEQQMAEILYATRPIALLDIEMATALLRTLIGAQIPLSDAAIRIAMDRGELELYFSQALRYVGFTEASCKDIAKLMIGVWDNSLSTVTNRIEFSKIPNPDWERFVKQRGMTGVGIVTGLTTLLIAYTKLKAFDADYWSSRDYGAWADWMVAAAVSTPAKVANQLRALVIGTSLVGVEKEKIDEALVDRFGAGIAACLKHTARGTKLVESFGGVLKVALGVFTLGLSVREFGDAWNRGDNLALALKGAEVAVGIGSIATTVAPLFVENVATAAITVGALTIPLWSVSLGLFVASSLISLAGWLDARWERFKLERALESMGLFWSRETIEVVFDGDRPGASCVVVEVLSTKQLLWSGVDVATVRWHPDVTLRQSGPVATWGPFQTMLAALEAEDLLNSPPGEKKAAVVLASLKKIEAEEAQLVEQIRRDGTLHTIRSHIGIRVTGSARAGEWSADGSVIFGEPRFTCVLTAGVAGTVTRLEMVARGIIEVDAVVARIGDREIHAPYGGVVVSVVVLPGSKVRAEDALAWVQLGALAMKKA